MGRPIALVDRTERVLIVVQRNLGVDHQGLAPRDPHDNIRPQPNAFSVADADFGREVAMLGEAATLKHIAKLLFTPAAARLWRIS